MSKTESSCEGVLSSCMLGWSMLQILHLHLLGEVSCQLHVASRHCDKLCAVGRHAGAALL